MVFSINLNWLVGLGVFLLQIHSNVWAKNRMQLVRISVFTSAMTLYNEKAMACCKMKILLRYYRKYCREKQKANNMLKNFHVTQECLMCK